MTKSIANSAEAVVEQKPLRIILNPGRG